MPRSLSFVLTAAVLVTLAACQAEEPEDRDAPLTSSALATASDAQPAPADAAGDAAGDATPDAGCEAQPEPACPTAPEGAAPVDPKIPSKALCRGACGGNCPSTCRPLPAESSCHEWQTADCQWHAKVCNYTMKECGSHAGCRAHDKCYDDCVKAKIPALCRRLCDATCVTDYDTPTCAGWALGNPPYDSWLKFADAPTSYTYDSTCY